MFAVIILIQKQMLPILSSMNNIQNAQANCNLLISLMTVSVMAAISITSCNSGQNDQLAS